MSSYNIPQPPNVEVYAIPGSVSLQPPFHQQQLKAAPRRPVVYDHMPPAPVPVSPTLAVSSVRPPTRHALKMNSDQSVPRMWERLDNRITGKISATADELSSSKNGVKKEETSLLPSNGGSPVNRTAPIPEDVPSQKDQNDIHPKTGLRYSTKPRLYELEANPSQNIASNSVYPLPPVSKHIKIESDDLKRLTCSLNLICYRPGSQGCVLRQIRVIQSSLCPNLHMFEGLVAANPDLVTTDQQFFERLREEYQGNMCSLTRRLFSLKTLRKIRLLSVSTWTILHSLIYVLMMTYSTSQILDQRLFL
jgi:hypothetical protein